MKPGIAGLVCMDLAVRDNDATGSGRAAPGHPGFTTLKCKGRQMIEEAPDPERKEDQRP